MTIQEIRDLVAKKISGQGTMVDVGGGLPAILNGILDLIAASPSLDTIVGDLDAKFPTWEGESMQVNPSDPIFTKPILEWKGVYYVLASFVPEEITASAARNFGARNGYYWCNCDFNSDSRTVSSGSAIFKGKDAQNDNIIAIAEY